jgi:hypothetical protein
MHVNLNHLMGNERSSTLTEEWPTVDLVNRFPFGPRLCHLMDGEGRREENTYRLEGKASHHL